MSLRGIGLVNYGFSFSASLWDHMPVVWIRLVIGPLYKVIRICYDADYKFIAFGRHFRAGSLPEATS